MTPAGAPPSPPAADLRVELLADPDAVRAEWSGLAQAAGNIFATWEWTATWWRHFGRDRPRVVAACRRADGTIAGLLPLYLSSRAPVRVVRFLGSGPSDELGPICAPADRGAVVRALQTLLADMPWRWDLLLAERLPGQEPWDELIGGTALRREQSPVLRIDDMTWEAFLASRSANFREQVRRRERKLAREHDLRYRTSDDPERLEGDLETLFGLHGARWGDRGSGALVAGRASFHRDFAARALERGWLRLTFLELDGRPAAAWYGFRFAGAEWYYQAGRDPARQSESVGFVLLAHSIRAAFDDGLREYRLLRGGEPYKMRFASQDPGVETRAVSRGLAGRAALAGARGALALPPGARRALMRLAG